jgi:hypothetical protein
MAVAAVPLHQSTATIVPLHPSTRWRRPSSTRAVLLLARAPAIEAAGSVKKDGTAAGSVEEDGEHGRIRHIRRGPAAIAPICQIQQTRAGPSYPATHLVSNGTSHHHGAWDPVPWRRTGSRPLVARVVPSTLATAALRIRRAE